jgi:hypothetical protein
MCKLRGTLCVYIYCTSCILIILYRYVSQQFTLEVRADAICSAAARRPLFNGGGGAPFSFCRQRPHKIFSGAPAAARCPETPDPISHFLFSIFLQFYQYTVSLPFTYYLTGKHRCKLWVVQWGPVPTTFQSGGDGPHHFSNYISIL